ncbi:helix-turn-helix domain-containing protein [Nocardia wallacei]|uniref:helix-turn-helix domain-containing protein n=1 Tax=Nocardia wallacei TaxID=480035 RepID=UPI002453A015|nr:helix-turn-helix transcriptional regulator [Nocardia wallacei]
MIESNAARAAVPGSGTEPGTDPALLRLVLGTRLRRLREAAGISGQAAGRAIRASHSKISRLEAGRVGFRAIDIDDLLSLYGVEDPDTRADFLRLAKRANATGRWQVDGDLGAQRLDTYLALEDAAALLRSYSPGVLPDLLQTAAYAHAVAAIARPGPTADIQRRVELLMRRQRLLQRPGAPKVWLVIEEAVLRRPFGGTGVWQDQLDHVAAVAAAGDAIVQIVPDHVGGPAISSVPFTLLRFAEQDLGDIVHLHHATGAQFLDRRADLDAYHAIWDRLCVHASPPDQSLELITALATGRSARAAR